MPKAREFFNCPDCGALTLPRDQEVHRNICSSGEDISKATQIDHGFIIDSRLHAKGSEQKEKPEGISGWKQEKAVMMSPKTMLPLRLFLEAPCYLSTRRGLSLHCAYPSEKMEKLDIGMPSPEPGLWHVLIPVRHWKKATLIQLRALDGKGHPGLAAAVSNHLLNAFVTRGEVVSVPHYGTVWKFRVEEAAEEEGEEEVSFDLLNRDLSSLSLNSSLDSDPSIQSPKTTQSPRTPGGGKAKTRNVMGGVCLPDEEALKQDVFQIKNNTKVEILWTDSPGSTNMTRFAEFGGADDVKLKLRELVIEPILSVKSCPIHKILIHAATGLGKSHLLRCLQGELPENSVFLRPIDGKEPFPEPCPENSCLLLDNLERRVKKEANVGSLEEALDNLPSRTWIIATTDSPEAVPLALRRRFHLELEITVPSAAERLAILKILMKNAPPVETIKSVAEAAHGYTGSDLASVVRQWWVSRDRLGDEQGLRSALEQVTPSAMKEIVLELPRVSWNDVGGQEELKAEVKQAVEWPLLYPEAFARLGVQPSKGILLYGPPGCSKTMIARAIATESGLNFLAVKGPELFSKWVGDSEKAVRKLFARARRAAPSVVFFDEIDALGASRGESGGKVGDRVLAQLLTEIDGLEQSEGVTVVAATNRPDVLDEALLRPGRLDKLLYVPLPSHSTRSAIFELRLRKIPTASDVDVEWLAKASDGYSGAEIVGVCNEAAMVGMREDLHIPQLTKTHFEIAFASLPPRTLPWNLSVFQTFKCDRNRSVVGNK